MTTAHVEPLELPTRLTAPPRLTQRHPWLLPAAMAVHRARRRTQWVRDAWSGRVVWAARHDDVDLPVRLKQHGSLLLRELDPDRMHLQHNKVTNLRLAASRMDGLVIAPGETMSFNRVVGNCTRRKGYVDGMKLANGAAGSGVGGGICQLANLVHWMVLHSADGRGALGALLRPVPGPGARAAVGRRLLDRLQPRRPGRAQRHRARLPAPLLGRRPLPARPAAHRRAARTLLQGRGARGAVPAPRGPGLPAQPDLATGHRPSHGDQVGEELVRSNCALVVYEPDPGVDVIDVG